MWKDSMGTCCARQPGLARRPSRAPRIVIRTEKVQRYVRLVAHDPAVVRHGWDVEKIPGPQLDDAPVVERYGCDARDDEPDVLDAATRRARTGPNVNGPLPPRLIRRAADREAADMHDLESSLRELADFVRCVELREDDVEHLRLRISVRPSAA